MLKLDFSNVGSWVSGSDVDALKGKSSCANELLTNGKGEGSDFLGWVNLPSSVTQEELSSIKEAADSLRAIAEVVVVIGIGGSYLGSKAVLEALGGSFDCMASKRKDPYVVFAGQNLSQDYMYELLDAVKERSFAVIVISKSGTTTEPAIAFRILRAEIEKRYGRTGGRSRIIAVTDASKGALKKLADEEGYRTFVIPDNVGGRFSVLTPVGLLPMAVAGIDIGELLRGAADMEASTSAEVPFEKNPAMQYAAVRNALYQKGYKIEILGSYDPRLQYVAEWWKQLFGESEGKQGKGIFPASVTLTADLHSMGQYIQEGERILFETILSVKNTKHDMVVGKEKDDLDGLNFLAGKSLGEINRMAELGVALAHVDGGVPNIRIEIPDIDAYNTGALLYFFEKACGISGYMLGVNPFDQPGVEAYKKNMFALLDKPGFEQESAALQKRIAEKQ